MRTKIQLKNDDGKKVNLERPKVLYNEETKKFVLWVHFENGKDYHDAAVGILHIMDILIHMDTCPGIVLFLRMMMVRLTLYLQQGITQTCMFIDFQLII